MPFKYYRNDKLALDKHLSHLNQVRLRALPAIDYIQECANEIPGIAEAEKSGMLKGFLYEPSEDELKGLIKNSLAETIDNELDIYYIVHESIEAYKQKPVATVVPTSSRIWLDRIPLYILFTDWLLSSPVIKNDADVKSVIRHELQHIEDSYNGITLGGMLLSDYQLSPNTFGPMFYYALSELRADYRQLEDVLKERFEKGRVGISLELFVDVATNYAKNWQFIRGAFSDLEREIRMFQFIEFKGIVPKRKDNMLILRFNLFGKQAIGYFEEPNTYRILTN